MQVGERRATNCNIGLIRKFLKRWINALHCLITRNWDCVTKGIDGILRHFNAAFLGRCFGNCKRMSRCLAGHVRKEPITRTRQTALHVLTCADDETILLTSSHPGRSRPTSWGLDRRSSQMNRLTSPPLSWPCPTLTHVIVQLIVNRRSQSGTVVTTESSPYVG